LATTNQTARTSESKSKDNFIESNLLVQ